MMDPDNDKFREAVDIVVDHTVDHLSELHDDVPVVATGLDHLPVDVGQAAVLWVSRRVQSTPTPPVVDRAWQRVREALEALDEGIIDKDDLVEDLRHLSRR